MNDCFPYKNYFQSNHNIFDIIETRPTISLQMKCCEMRGVPDKCMHTCGEKTSSLQARGNPSCMNYMDVIENCKNGKYMLSICLIYHQIF